MTAVVCICLHGWFIVCHTGATLRPVERQHLPSAPIRNEEDIVVSL